MNSASVLRGVRSITSSTRLALVSGAAAAAVLAASCGGAERAVASRDSGSTRTTAVVSPQVWSDRVDAACADAGADHVHLQSATPETEDEAVEHAVEVDRLSDAILHAVEQGGLPRGREQSAEMLLSQLGQLAEQTGLFADAASAGDRAAATAAVAEITVLGAQINPVAIDLSVPSCGGF